ncbi:hypothetical protein IGI04_025097 [Brassica rapa subsp. trilocularis]|uniref:Uncharacterized protein n=1 Tax=Brassica rapa subsp. trilocularis TaxID=1813537 RepID=A0ABQ7M8L4_BRACM|nr:hypothetical protein IGI04_025097 [Brassica rapa subsp. trilocularis]
MICSISSPPPDFQSFVDVFFTLYNRVLFSSCEIIHHRPALKLQQHLVTNRFYSNSPPLFLSDIWNYGKFLGFGMEDLDLPCEVGRRYSALMMRSNYSRPMNLFLLKFVGLLIKLSLLMVKDCGIIEFQRFMW